MGNLKQKAKQIKQTLPAIYLSVLDPRTPLSAKIVAALCVGYALSPIDLIPDFIPVLGYVDDVILLPAMILLVIKMIPKDLWQQKKEEAKGLWVNGKPKKWYCAIPILLLYIWIIYKLGKLIFG